MNIRRATPVLITLSLLLAFAVSVASQQSDGIVVNNADEVWQTSVSMTQGLTESLAGVKSRIVLQYANELRHLRLMAVPGTLQTLLGQISARVIVQYANTIRRERLPPIPSALQTLLEQVSDRVVLQYANSNRREALVYPDALQTLLGQVSDRIVLQYANSNRREVLVYPVALLNDTIPPQISGIVARTTGVGTATIAWTTDEFATSTVLYGTQPGVYPRTVSDPLYTKQHEITLTGLTPGTTYYYQVRSTDRSGNTSTSAEHSFIARFYIYLPLVMQNSP